MVARYACKSLKKLDFSLVASTFLKALAQQGFSFLEYFYKTSGQLNKIRLFSLVRFIQVGYVLF